MRDIIHIGYPRTATTWFQKNIFPKVRNYTFIPRNIVQQNLILELPDKYDPGWINPFRIQDDGLIVSEEMITGKYRAGLANYFFLETYARRIKENFNNPLVVIFLRNQPESIYSMYNLYIKKGGTFSFRNFIAQDTSLKKQLLFSTDYYCYNKSLEIISSILGKENVKIYLYEDFVKSPSEFIRNIAKDLDFIFDLDSITYEKTNSGFSPFKLQIKRILNRFTSYGVPFKQFFFHVPLAYKLFQKGNKKNYKMPKKFMNRLEQYNPEFADSNNKIMKEYNLHRMKNYNYPM